MNPLHVLTPFSLAFSLLSLSRTIFALDDDEVPFRSQTDVPLTMCVCVCVCVCVCLTYHAVSRG